MFGVAAGLGGGSVVVGVVVVVDGAGGFILTAVGAGRWYSVSRESRENEVCCFDSSSRNDNDKHSSICWLITSSFVEPIGFEQTGQMAELCVTFSTTAGGGVGILIFKLLSLVSSVLRSIIDEPLVCFSCRGGRTKEGAFGVARGGGFGTEVGRTCVVVFIVNGGQAGAGDALALLAWTLVFCGDGDDRASSAFRFTAAPLPLGLLDDLLLLLVALGVEGVVSVDDPFSPECFCALCSSND